MSNTNNNMQTQASSALHNAIMEASGKAIANSPSLTYYPKPKVVPDDDSSLKEKEINKNMTLILIQAGQYDNQRAVNVIEARENVGTQEVEAHYIYMSKIQEVTPDAADNSTPIFDVEPLEKQSDTNITPDSSNMSNNGEEANQDD
nr:hypothetical protein [Tanacetum cinerariifolium]